MIDEKDLSIIDMLRENARIPVTEIASRLDVSESTIRKRIRGLEKNGVITQYTVVVDPSKLGYNSVSMVGIDVESTHLLDVAMRMTEFPEVKFVATSTGDHMIITEIWTNDSKELGRFIAKNIEKQEGVKRVSPTIILENWKVHSGYLLP
ncbi:MAG: AsnC family transcriptional regulator [Methanosarcinales archaeon]|jgi:Lrp/AsnC family transcriptional regulator for asnA, asnC and gidA|nr:MAG: Lrp/AsnC family transcriptional regulator, regulator for asnA, asnC and gidA [ANME-2 cluster archaeon]KAF5423802.1 MAG: Lrp/AsnC family transcriptional regulator, regulator for asnA, asnC and gidA [ANME-2 cluster archaeon]MRG76207.1 AsnC family transcriptional regulator [ANME-2 cluster archaeon]NOR59578.1 AsnC family transcriptional regulator [Methanosarcinales archaeon]